MTLDELRGQDSDVLAIASFSDGQTIAILLSRANGAGLKQLLAAALSVARDLLRQIIELENALENSEQWANQLEGDIAELQERLEESLSRQKQTKGKTLSSA